jgi:hypothetical protein
MADIGGVRVAWWVVGALTSLLLFAGTTWAVHVEGALGAQAALLATRGERIAALERDVAALSVRLARVEGADR